MTTKPDARTRSGRRKFLAILGLFLVPPAIAWTLYFSGWQPGSTGNHGELVDPPVQLEVPGLEVVTAPGDTEPPDLRGDWTLLLTLNAPCQERCLEQLRATRQVRTALAEDAGRLQRVLVVPADGTPPAERQLFGHADLHVVRAPALDWTQTARDGEAVSVSLVDTRGFQMMRYQTPLDASGLLSDLRHLMRLSNRELEELNDFPEEG